MNIPKWLLKHWLTLFLGLLWSLVIYIGFVIPISLPRELDEESRKQLKPVSSPASSVSSNQASSSDTLWILTADKKEYVAWDRKEAIKFSLDAIVSSINYLFLASAAVLGFLIKILIDPQLDLTKQHRPIDATISTLLRHTAFGCVLSISSGFFARSYFSNMAYARTFSIYKELGFAALGQIMAFFISGLLLVFAANAIMKNR